MPSQNPIVAIVGRPNVGKSTLFNRLCRTRKALVDDRPGITRDRLTARIRLLGLSLTLVDTGGYDEQEGDPLLEQVKAQVQVAVDEADAIIFMVDGRAGILPGDQEIAALLRRSRKPVFLAANKIEGPEHDPLLLDVYRLGFEEVFALSAAHGYGVPSFTQALAEGLPAPKRPADEEDENCIHVAVLGRPNAGKSSLINRLIGVERLLVNELPGTTRDAVDILCTRGERRYLFVDTAGIRKRAKIREKIEKFSVIKALRSLERCDVALILLDAGRGVAEQDVRICGYALEQGKGVVLVLNKWDLVQKDAARRRQLEEAVDRQLRFVAFAPRLRISALTGQGVERLFSPIDTVYRQASTRITTGVLNSALHEITALHPPPRLGRGRVKILYATQSTVRPPTFILFVNRPDKLHFSYERFLINQLRGRFNMAHAPLKLDVRKR